ncbi:DNA-binding protein SMUBP-2 [Dorcoceras hygrometricum]|uniref:DNA-binding protein SMUBP-2 n=1 Tax=Dorcoceras hygrometricum TaxID=472368 RepID=A0A2Z7BYC2_9LAMI|nr:DNA-binding protein SMUBP-2 [Dorcoceras hygrometricum]
MEVNEAAVKAKDFRISFENLCESAKSEIDALAETEKELISLVVEQGERVLVTAPTNAAVDNRVEKLSDIGANIVRILNQNSRGRNQI